MAECCSAVDVDDAQVHAHDHEGEAAEGPDTLDARGNKVSRLCWSLPFFDSCSGSPNLASGDSMTRLDKLGSNGDFASMARIVSDSGPNDRRRQPTSINPPQTGVKGPKSPRSINTKHLSAELLKEGQRLLLEGHNDACELVLCEALKYTPSDANVLAARCQCYNAQGKHAEAMRDIKAATMLQPRWTMGLKLQATTAERMGQLAEAAETFEKAEWLAQVQDNDPAAAAECKGLAADLRARMLAAPQPAEDE